MFSYVMFMFKERLLSHINNIFLLLTVVHSVPGIVALVSACAIAHVLMRAMYGAMAVFTQPKQVFKDCALIFLNCNWLSQPTKHTNKIIISIFWLWRPQSLAHTVRNFDIFERSLDWHIGAVFLDNRYFGCNL